MESLTLASMKHLPTAVLFVFDLTGLSGDAKSSLDDQFEVRRELRERFPRRPWFDVVSKADLPAADGAMERLEELGIDFLHVSTVTGDGLDELEGRVRTMLAQVEKVLATYAQQQEQEQQLAPASHDGRPAYSDGPK